MNGTTSEDRTNYYETLPAECLDLALFLEADRMRPSSSPRRKLANQREAVKEEKRLRIDNQPYAPSFEWRMPSRTTPFRTGTPSSARWTTSIAPRWTTRATSTAGTTPRERPSLPERRRGAGGRLRPRPARLRRRPGARDAPPFLVSEPPPHGERRARVDDLHAALPALHVNAKGPVRREADAFALLYAEKILGR